jgi:hypothetical protein
VTESLQAAPARMMHEAVRVKLKVQWRPKAGLPKLFGAHIMNPYVKDARHGPTGFTLPC